MNQRFSVIAISLSVMLAPTTSVRATGDPKNAAKRFDEQVRPVLVKHCNECHAIEKAKGKFRIDKLTGDFTDTNNREHWLSVVEQLKSGAMPPEGKPRLTDKERKAIFDWIGERVQAAAALRKEQGRVVLRRLNRAEYENTVRDLLGIYVELRELLPQDGSANGFDNVAEVLNVSSFLMEKYLEAADRSLGLAIANQPQPPLVKKRYSLKETHHVKATTESVFRRLDDGTVVCFSSSPWQAVTLSPFYPSDRGKYRFRVSASGFQSKEAPVTYQIIAGSLSMGGPKNHLVGYFDVPADKPTVVEFVDTLEARNTIRLHPYGLAGSQTVHKIGAANYEGKGLAVQWIEVEGPLYDTWPPESHRRLFGDLPQKASPRFNQSKRVEVDSKDPEADAERILRSFARRAFRRNVTDDDIKPFVKLVKARLADKYSFEQAVRVGLTAIMVSPDFLFLRERPGQLDDFALASRLSYFLWSTMPDDELLTLAEQKKLGEPKTLRAQVERMLKSPRAEQFTENFVGQWLNLRDIDATVPSHILYPEYDEMLKQSMLRETYLFFEELLKDDLSLANIIHSDFTMLNGRLAKHYGITDSGVRGLWEFKKVQLPKDSHRGGVLTMASVLKVTANGTYTSPIPRGAYVLERILDQPPPRPPEGISAIEPDIRGTKTIRQQLAKHREVAACASCHAKIDPPGFALESFDVIGGWRDYYRTSGNGKTVMLDGRRMPYLQGPKVDSADITADGHKFQGIDEFKQILLKDKDQIARALAGKLVTYATGAAPQLGDRDEIETIVRSIREKNYGLRSLVHEIVQSRLFLHK